LETKLNKIRKKSAIKLPLVNIADEEGKMEDKHKKLHIVNKMK
jgi:hypothetical protein